MYDVKIINGEAILFDDDNQVEYLEHLRNGFKHIHYYFPDGSYVRIFDDNSILWYDSDDMNHREGDMPAQITTNGYMSYWKHGKFHRECGPAVIWPSGRVEYYLDDVEYTKEEYINKLNSDHGIILCMT